MKMQKRTAFILGGTFLLGCVSMAAVSGDPEVRYEVVHVQDDPVTITETVTNTVTVVPEACIELVRLTDLITAASGRLDASSSRLLDIMSEERQALATGDIVATNNLETRLRRLNSDTVEAVMEIGELQYDYKDAAHACKEQS